MIEFPIRGRLLSIPHPSPRVKIEGAPTFFEIAVKQFVEWLAVALVLALFALTVGLLAWSCWPTSQRPSIHGDAIPFPRQKPSRAAFIRPENLIAALLPTVYSDKRSYVIP